MNELTRELLENQIRNLKKDILIYEKCRDEFQHSADYNSERALNAKKGIKAYAKVLRD